MMMMMSEGANSFNQDLSSWDVRNVRSMLGMFEGAHVYNQNISNWDVSNVTQKLARCFDMPRPLEPRFIIVDCAKM
jgi:surface protein